MSSDQTGPYRVDVQDGGAASDVSCAACGRSNARARLLCGGCGAPLDALGAELAVGPYPAATQPAPRRTAGGWWRHWWLAVLAVLVVSVLIVGGLAWARIGPFADPSPDPVAAPESPELTVAEAEALAVTDVASFTTRAAAEDRSFPAEAVADGDPETVWHGDADELPAGTNETLDLFLAAPAWVTALTFENGDHVDAETYAAYARVRQVHLHFDGETAFEVTLLDLGRAMQVVELPEPVLTTAVRLEVLEVFPGGQGTDPAISSIEVLGRPAEGEALEIGTQRAESHPAAGVVELPAS